ncbi:aminotransferase class IV family protein [Streptomyces sp. H27-D2]|uniref:aminotransferase class IV family protein n=1 Tax=Streptomyces sp. H27-D2 TaxID=3046304 RepID=UPI002DB80298|nr:aminotransferase class IV family protein [Streptomyces sp. H27-D2]MEC4019358.1 aminotransferase class IV family protein [Streptomyces sp. H27-D2]
MMVPAAPRIEINGRAVGAGDLWSPLLSGYGHFTAMQVRGGRVRGIDLHLARLDAATHELYGVGLAGERVRDCIRHALGDDISDASVRVNVFSPEAGAGSEPGSDADNAAEPAISVLVSVRPPGSMPDGPWSLRTVEYQRPVAHIKHVGGFGQVYYGRVAKREGFDEALLVRPDGVIAEGAITNIAFIEGGTVVWPDAPALRGITMQVLERELDRAGLPWRRRTVRVAELASFDGAFVTNSRGIAPVGRIDDQILPADVELVGTVTRILASAAWEAI